MATETEEKIELNIKEEGDGSAVVELPDDLVKEDGEESHAEGGDAQTSAAEAAEEEGLDAEELENLRAKRRAKRKARRELEKRTSEEKDSRIQLLEKQLQQFQERLAVTERRTHSAELGRIDKAIEDSELKIQYAKMKVEEATAAGDGQAMIKAQEMWYEARRNAEALKSVKEQAVKAPQNAPMNDNTREMQRHAADWMDRNPWYNPEGDDEDSEIAKLIDQKMVKEGWNPSTKEYWRELDKRLSKRVPHLYNDDSDENSSRRPRQVVTSTGRERFGGSNPKSVTIPPELVRSIKDAGMWDNKPARDRIIAGYFKNQRNA
jgi:hypothetical protein